MTDRRSLIERAARAIALDHLRLEGVNPAELDTLIVHQEMWWEAMKSHAIAALDALVPPGEAWIAPWEATDAICRASAEDGGPGFDEHVREDWRRMRTAHLAPPETGEPKP